MEALFACLISLIACNLQKFLHLLHPCSVHLILHCCYRSGWFQLHCCTHEQMLHLINTLQNMFTNLTTDFSSQNIDASEEERLSSLNAVPYRFHYDDTNHKLIILAFRMQQISFWRKKECVAADMNSSNDTLQHMARTWRLLCISCISFGTKGST